MKYGVLNLVLGLVLSLYGMALGGWAWLVVWLGLDFMLLGIAYLRRSRLVFGKRPDGSLNRWRWLLFFPMHLYTSVVWHCMRLLTRESPFDATPVSGLMIGRRLLPGELPRDTHTVVDLTAEFAEPRAIRTKGDYRSFPMLDATAPDVEQLRDFITSLPDAPMYVHCAQGHGRTGLFTVAFLVWRKKVENAEAGMAVLAKARPGALLNAEQMMFVSRFLKEAE
jgi:hypothetical protein